jgi:hypothetical protein
MARHTGLVWLNPDTDEVESIPVEDATPTYTAYEILHEAIIVINDVDDAGRHAIIKLLRRLGLTDG